MVRKLGFCHHDAEQDFARALQKFGERDAQFKMQIVDDFGGGVADFAVFFKKIVIPLVSKHGSALADIFVQIAVFALVAFTINLCCLLDHAVEGALHGGAFFVVHFLSLVLVGVSFAFEAVPPVRDDVSENGKCVFGCAEAVLSDGLCVLSGQFFEPVERVECRARAEGVGVDLFEGVQQGLCVFRRPSAVFLYRVSEAV